MPFPKGLNLPLVRDYYTQATKGMTEPTHCCSNPTPSDGASIVAGQIKSPGDQDGAKSEAGLLTICKPTRGEKMVKRAAPVRRIERIVSRAASTVPAKKEAPKPGGACGAKGLLRAGP